jgi:small-conductance mechanosensitive channel
MTRICQTARRHLAAALLALAALTGPASAQAPAPPPAAAPAPQAPAPQTPAPAPQPPAPQPPAAAPPPAAEPREAEETKPVRAELDRIRLDFERREAALRGRDLADGELQALRGGVDDQVERARALVDGLTPRLDAARARLDQLGAKPEEGAAPESPELQADRRAREAVVAEFDETQRLGRAVMLQGQQIAAQIAERRRTLFARAVFRQSQSLASPGLWVDVARVLPREMAAFRFVFGDWADRVRMQATSGSVALVLVAMLAAAALHWGRRRLLPRLVTRNPAARPGPLTQHVAALQVLVLGTLPAAVASLAVYAALDGGGFLPVRVRPVAGAALAGLAFVAFVIALADAVLAPGREGWRLVRMSDAGARRLMRLAVAVAWIIGLSKVADAVNAAIAAALPLAVLTRGLFAAAAAVAIAATLRRFATTEVQDEACLGPYIPESNAGGPLRILGWGAVAALVGGLLTGYVAFAAFLVDQIAWVAILAAMLFLSVRLVDVLLVRSLRDPTRLSSALQANTGLRRRSLQQIAVVVDGVARVVLILAAALLALAPWGVESRDLLSSLRAAFFGLQVGDITISLSSVVLAITIFALGVFATRIVQRWLETAFLPATDLDAGLRNSIKTAFGYLGFFIAAALSLSSMGLGLERIALVAGALSVGIGFGLQSIVNNFVSGLILLWERPIRVGDLIVVGDGEGHVRRISVRSTEIETFDRSTIIVPNSNLISGVVRNRVRGDRTGRVVLPIAVLRNQDPVRAAELLTACAAAHPDVLKEPPPRVNFKKIGDTWLEFDLVAFVADVEFQTRVQTELNFAVFKRLTDEGFIPPLGAPSMTVQGLGSVEAALEHIASAIATAERPAPPPRQESRA